MMLMMIFERNQVLSFPSATCSPSEGSDQELTGQTSAKTCQSWAASWAEVSGNAYVLQMSTFP